MTGMLTSPKLVALPRCCAEDDSLAVEVTFEIEVAVAVEPVLVLKLEPPVVVADALDDPV
jgi:hypothetical protein